MGGQKIQGDYDEEDLYSGVLKQESNTVNSWNRSKTMVKPNSNIEKITSTKDAESDSGENKPRSTRLESKPTSLSQPQPQSRVTLQHSIPTEFQSKVSTPKKNYASVAAAAVAPAPSRQKKVTSALKGVKNKDYKPTFSTITTRSDLPLSLKQDTLTDKTRITEGGKINKMAEASLKLESNGQDNNEESIKTKENETATRIKDAGGKKPDTEEEKDSELVQNQKPLETKKVGSKLNANAKEFTFNPSAASFTPSNLASTNTQSTSESAANSSNNNTPVQYIHPQVQHSGMIPVMNTQFGVATGGIRYQNAYYGVGGQPFPYHLPQHVQMQTTQSQSQQTQSQQTQSQQTQSQQTQSEDGDRAEQSTKQPEQSQVPVQYGMPPGVYYNNPNQQQQAMMHSRGASPHTISGFVPGQQQVMTGPHHIPVMPGTYSYRMYAPHMHQQQTSTVHGAQIVQQMPHPSSFYPPNMQGSSSSGIPYPSNFGPNPNVDENDPNFRRSGRGNSRGGMRRNNSGKNRRSSGTRTSYNTSSPNPVPPSTSPVSSESRDASIDRKINSTCDGVKPEKDPESVESEGSSSAQ